MADIRLENISKKFDGADTAAVKDINLYIEDGSFTILLGPSGCGKSTTLRMIAGLERQTSGDIYIGDRLVNDVDAGNRNVAMVFQNYALYPTMTVKENIEFGLINNKVEKKEREKIIAEIMEIVSLEEFMDRMPSQLSGGQRQRVALARAMVKKPEVFILDEPLSNLDAKLRVQMRSELKKLHKKLNTTFVYVTHDQIEAMSMGTDIVVMNKGDIMQVEKPREVYNNPANVFTAKFIGTPPMNIIEIDDNVRKHFNNIDENAKYIGFRPEDTRIHLKDSKPTCNVLINGLVYNTEILGAETVYTIDSEIGSFDIKSFEKRTFIDNALCIEILDKGIKFFDKDEKLINGDTKYEDISNELDYLVAKES